MSKANKIFAAMLGVSALLILITVLVVYKKEPEHVSDELTMMALERANAGFLEEAAMLFERAVRRDPENPNNHYNLGQTYLGLDRIDDAVTSLYKAASMKPNDPQFLVEYSRVLSIKRSSDEAVSLLMRAIDLDFCDEKRVREDPDFEAVRLHDKWVEISRHFRSKCGKRLKE